MDLSMSADSASELTTRPLKWQELSSPSQMAKNQPKQKTDKGLEIPVPKRSEFDAAIEKVAPPAGRKRPAEKDQPPERSD